MKKIISLALVILMLFSITFFAVSCGDDTDPPSSDDGGENDDGNGEKDDGKQNTYPGDTPPVILPSI